MSGLIAFRKARDAFGWMSNMSPHTIGVWRTAEHIFQAKRFRDDSLVRGWIKAEGSPMAAKMVAKKNAHEMIVEPRSEIDIENMRQILQLKIEQHPLLREALIDTGIRQIIEDCSARANASGLFWGAARQADGWKGENVLGKLWMELRDRICT